MCDGPGPWAGANHVGDLDEIPGTWLQPGVAPGIINAWGEKSVKRPHLSLTASAFQVNNFF